MRTGSIVTVTILVAVSLVPTLATAADGLFEISKRYRVETGPESGRYHALTKTESWDPKATAVIVCDVWDVHHSLNAVRRVKQIAPRINELLKHARQRGALIIHAPSGCVDFYKNHPARQRARSVPRAKNFPADIGVWCHKIPSEEKGGYPLDQSDGGRDDDPDELRQWHEQLRKMGRDPDQGPWIRQIDTIDISKGDAISDSGVEVWSLLEHRKIKNVILVGVHTNMCVLGRPFGLRQLSKNGKNIVLVRDLTDTMYNPERWPHVSHFTGTDLIVEHIEKFVCPTTTSDTILGGSPFRFQLDTRPHIVFVIAEKEYDTKRTLPEFAARHLGKHFRCSCVFGSETDRNELPGLELLDDADLLVLSVRRRFLRAPQLDRFRAHLDAGKPLVAIRTSSHAFAARDLKKAPEGRALWQGFDPEVLGGRYSGHHSNQGEGTPDTLVQVVSKAKHHPILAGVRTDEFASSGSLYKTSPLAKTTHVLMTGRVEHASEASEPVAWTNLYQGGRVFYTSLGHRADFEDVAFQRLFRNAIFWALHLDAPSMPAKGMPRQSTSAE